MRLAADSEFLGGRRRSPGRVGKRVTQEELAEHLEISRNWYTKFEGGTSAGFSISLLNRLADILLLSAPERAELIRLAMPELAQVVSPDSASLFESLGVVRRAVKRLWNASSEGDILRLAGEEARQLLPSFELIFARRIVALEEAQFPQPGGNSAAYLAKARANALHRLTPAQLARLNSMWQCTPAGAVADRAGGLVREAVTTPEACPGESLRPYRIALREDNIKWDSVLAAHIRGSSGSAVVGGTSTRPHHVTELERTMLSAIADFASLVLK